MLYCHKTATYKEYSHCHIRIKKIVQCTNSGLEKDRVTLCLLYAIDIVKMTTNIRCVTLNLEGWINWKTKTSPSRRLWAMEKPLQPPLNPFLSIRYLVGDSSSFSSTKTTMASCFGKWQSQNLFGKPCYIHTKKKNNKTIVLTKSSNFFKKILNLPTKIPHWHVKGAYT